MVSWCFMLLVGCFMFAVEPIVGITHSLGDRYFGICHSIVNCKLQPPTRHGLRVPLKFTPTVLLTGFATQDHECCYFFQSLKKCVKKYMCDILMIAQSFAYDNDMLHKTSRSSAPANIDNTKWPYVKPFRHLFLPPIILGPSFVVRELGDASVVWKKQHFWVDDSPFFTESSA